MNLLSLIQSQFSPQTIQQISGAVGESTEGTKSALTTAFPALLGSLVGKVTGSPNGPTEVFNHVKQGLSQGSWPDSISGMLSNLTGGGGGASSTGGSLLNSLLGSKLGAVGDFISSHCGIKGGSATSLLSMAAPFLMGTLGKQVTSQGLGASALGQLLTSQTQYLKDALPSGLANTLGIGHLLRGGPEAAEPAATRPVAHAEDRKESHMLRYAWVLVVLALAGWLVARWAHNKPATGGTAGPNATEMQTGRGAQTPTPQPLSLTPGSTADQLAQAVNSGDLSHPFTLQALGFDSAGNPAESARDQLQQISSVLNASPDLRLKLTGYGQTADAGMTQANGIKSAFTAAGVSADRIATTGEAGTGAPTMSLSQ